MKPFNISIAPTDLIVLASFAGEDQTRPQLAGVWFECWKDSTIAVATNGPALIACHFPDQYFGGPPVFVPLSAIEQALKLRSFTDMTLSEASIWVSGSNINFELQKDLIMPNWRVAIQQKGMPLERTFSTKVLDKITHAARRLKATIHFPTLGEGMPTHVRFGHNPRWLAVIMPLGTTPTTATEEQLWAK